MQQIKKGQGKHEKVFMIGINNDKKRGVTIDVATSCFETKTKKITLLDAPGHRDFVPRLSNS